MSWLGTDEATGTYATERGQFNHEEAVVMIFSDLATATAFKLKYG